jgi:glycosyltransferase involved in cell wall biosynthesis
MGLSAQHRGEDHDVERDGAAYSGSLSESGGVRTVLSVIVIVPVYNMPQHLLDRCLDSLDQQTYGNFTVAVVDDGSDEFRLDSHHHIIFRQSHQGQAASINHALAHLSLFTYWCTVSGDDTVTPDYLSRLVAAIQFGSNRQYASPDSSAPLELERILQGNYMHGGALFTMDLWQRLGPLDNHPLWDWRWFAKLAYHNVHGISVSDHLYNWITRKESVSRTLKPNTIDECRRELIGLYGSNGAH